MTSYTGEAKAVGWGLSEPLLPYLDVPHHPCGLHATGDIDGVAPDVVVRFPGTNHSR